MAKIEVDTSEFDSLIKDLGDLPEHVMDNAYRFFKAETPIRSGNARNRTKLKSNKTVIHANYPYAGRLDDGWSRQARDGMTEPTIDFIEDEVRRQLNRID